MRRENEHEGESREGGFIYFPQEDWEDLQKGKVVLKEGTYYHPKMRIGQSEKVFTNVGTIGEDGWALLIAIKKDPSNTNVANLYYILDTPENRTKIPLGADGETI